MCKYIHTHLKFKVHVTINRIAQNLCGTTAPRKLRYKKKKRARARLALTYAYISNDSITILYYTL